MFSRPFHLRIAVLVAFCFFAGITELFAGWLGFRNETKEQIVIQETVTVNNQSKQGKPQSLNSGDVVRDSQVCPANQRKFSIYDPKGNILFTGMFPCPGPNENILYILKKDAKGTIVVEPNKSAK